MLPCLSAVSLAVARGLLSRVLVLLLALLGFALPAPSLAQITLTGAVVQGTDAAGNLLPFYDWTTTPAPPNFAWKSWYIRGADRNGPFINGPTGAGAGINIPLASGSYTYTVYVNHNFAFPGTVPEPYGFGINLFFNGSGSPAISAFAPVATSADQRPGYSPNPGTVKLLNGATEPGAGSLCFDVGDRHVAISDFRFWTTSVFNRDRVGPMETSPDGSRENIGQFTLTVTSPLRDAPNIEIEYAGAHFDYLWPRLFRTIWGMRQWFWVRNTGCQTAFNVTFDGATYGSGPTFSAVTSFEVLDGLAPQAVSKFHPLPLWNIQYPTRVLESLLPGAVGLLEVDYNVIGGSFWPAGFPEDDYRPFPPGVRRDVHLTGSYYTEPPSDITGYLGKKGANIRWSRRRVPTP